MLVVVANSLASRYRGSRYIDEAMNKVLRVVIEKKVKRSVTFSGSNKLKMDERSIGPKSNWFLESYL